MVHAEILIFMGYFDNTWGTQKLNIISASYFVKYFYYQNRTNTLVLESFEFHASAYAILTFHFSHFGEGTVM